MHIKVYQRLKKTRNKECVFNSKSKIQINYIHRDFCLTYNFFPVNYYINWSKLQSTNDIGEMKKPQQITTIAMRWPTFVFQLAGIFFSKRCFEKNLFEHPLKFDSGLKYNFAFLRGIHWFLIPVASLLKVVVVK